MWPAPLQRVRDGLAQRRTFGSRSLSIQPVSIDSTAKRTG
jgi:hypothetical protein